MSHVAWCVCVSVCVFVCLSVGHTGEPCRNGGDDRDAVCEGRGRRTCVLHGGRDPSPGRGNFRGLSGPLGVSAAMYAAKPIIQSSITTRHAMRLFVQNSLTFCSVTDPY